MLHIPNMRRMLWLTLLTAIFSTASATDQDHECQGGHNCNDGGDVSADSDSSSSSESNSGAESTSGASSVSGSDISITNTRPKSVTVRNVPSPDTPNVYPSAPCRIARSGGLSFAGGALSGGSSIEDPECTLRETARTFQYLGVPEIGLHLLCTNSVVINGRRDKKGNLEKGESAPIGSAECLRLVREFQGDVDDTHTDTALTSEIEELREQQNRLEQRFAEKADELEREHVQTRQVAASRPAPVVTQQTVQQPMLSDEKRAKLSALFGDNDEETSE